MKETERKEGGKQGEREGGKRRKEEGWGYGRAAE
jgi:hypothetical protein